MTTAKERIQRVLDELPDDATLEDFEYEIYLMRKIDQGMEDIKAGRVHSQEEVEARLRRWTER